MMYNCSKFDILGENEIVFTYCAGIWYIFKHFIYIFISVKHDYNKDNLHKVMKVPSMRRAQIIVH